MVNLLVDHGRAGDIARDRIRAASMRAVPDLIDVETAAALRRLWKAERISARLFKAAIDDLAALPIDRFPTAPLLGRAYELRANITAYDAMYVALAEVLDYTLITADARLATAPGIRCHVEVVTE